MRYHYEPQETAAGRFGKIYICRHPCYNRCTLFVSGGKGLAVIQQRFSPVTKKTWWGEINPALCDPIYLSPKFTEYFKKRAGAPIKGLYPTVTVRQIMWALRMKPLKKERWETVFDRADI